jgi:lysophospholipase L1-like esterase
MIYIIGDSHVSVFSGTDLTYEGLRHIQPDYGVQYKLINGQVQALVSTYNRFEQRIPEFCPIKIGSPTAYNSYGKLPMIEHAIEGYQVTADDFVFLCFGEIDIRHHIGFHADSEGITIGDAIKKCVDRYFETIMYLKNREFKIGVYAPMGQSALPSNGINRIYRDVIYRNNMTIEFNKYLKEKCNPLKIPVADVSLQMILPDGTTNQHYLLDGHHLSQNIMPILREEFKRVINEV